MPLELIEKGRAAFNMQQLKHYHLVGIGGIGMSGIAQLLIRRGFRVSGSDLKDSPIIQELRRLGAEVWIGHDAGNIKGADTVVYSSAIKKDNPELREAKALGIPLLQRAEALAALMQEKTVITVTGSHGKTTTASLVSYLLLEAGLKPTLAVGGILRNIDTNASIGDGRFFVAEADESDGSFLRYQPDYSIITNVDYEHLDYYKDFGNEVGAFRQFLTHTKDNGCVFACSDDSVLRDLLQEYKRRYVFFGLNKGAQIVAQNIRLKELSSEFDCFHNGKRVDRFQLSLGGLHNISNSLAVIGLGLELGIDLASIKRTLLGYKGARRRLEVKFKDERYTVIDDYAHHPTEIRATLAAVRNMTGGRTVAVFQPHRFSRTKLLQEEFGKSFDLADYVVVTDIYSANEPAIEGVTGRLIYDKIKQYSPGKEVYFLPKEEIASHILKAMRPGDLIITLGAGDIVKTCDELAQEFNKRKG